MHLEETIFQVVFANNILKEAKSAYIPFFEKRGHSPKMFHSKSIVDIVKQYKEGTFSFDKDIDIVTGGFPCQDFSLAGKRKGFNSSKGHAGGNACEVDIANEENRGQLYMWMKEVVEITKPKVFLLKMLKV